MESLTDLLFVSFGLGLDGVGDCGFANRDPGELDRPVLVAERVAACGVLELGDTADIPGDQAGHGLAGLALHREQVSETLFGLSLCVPQRGVGADRSANHAKQGLFTREGVAQGFEHQGRRRAFDGGFDFDRLVADVERREGLALQGIGQALDDRLEQRSGADAVESRTHGEREDLAMTHRAAKPGVEVFGREAAIFEELLEQLVVAFGYGFDQLVAIRFDVVGQRVRYRDLLAAAPTVFLELKGRLGDQIDDTGEVVFPTYR